MRFQPTISFEQYRDACQAVAAAKLKSVRKQSSWMRYVSLVIICLAVGVSPQWVPARIPILIFSAVIALCWIFSKPLAKHSQNNCLRTIFAEEQEWLNNQILTINESGIACDGGGGLATSHHAWKAFIKRIDLPDALLFLPTPNSFIRVPKKMLSSADLELVCQWSSAVPAANGR